MERVWKAKVLKQAKGEPGVQGFRFRAQRFRVELSVLSLPKAWAGVWDILGFGTLVRASP